MGNRFKVELSGIAGHDPVLRYTNTKGTPVAHVRIAVNFPAGNGETRTTWYALEFWGKMAQAAMEKIKKGYHVIGEGTECRPDQWKTKTGDPGFSIAIPMVYFEAHPPANQIQNVGSSAPTPSETGSSAGSPSTTEAEIALLQAAAERIRSGQATASANATPTPAVDDPLAQIAARVAALEQRRS
jgi:single-stranded DNA-binding protein